MREIGYLALGLLLVYDCARVKMRVKYDFLSPLRTGAEEERYQASMVARALSLSNTSCHSLLASER